MAHRTVALVALCLTSALAVPLPFEDKHAFVFDNNAIDERIVGGSPAPDAAYPYQVSLRQRGSHFCGGSIINDNTILCAAHCTYGQSPLGMVIVVGTNYLNSGGTGYGVSQIMNHNGYNPQNNQHDISILRVNGRISFNERVKYINLANFIVTPGTKCILSGWGSTSYPGGNIPNALQHIQLTSISVAQCQSALPGFPVFHTHVCTFEKHGQGACHGDSGGPLITGNVQCGIVSWGIPCANGSPDIFTSVPHYVKWIYSKIDT